MHALAHKWEFEAAKEASKAFLVEMEDSITKLQIASRYEYEDWLCRAYRELAYRATPLSIDEAKCIGIEAATHVAQVREVRLVAKSRFRILHDDARVFITGGRKSEVYCSQCTNPTTAVTKHGTISFLGTTTTTTTVIGSQCEPCGIDFYGPRTKVDGMISERVDEEIYDIVSSIYLCPAVLKSDNSENEEVLLMPSAELADPEPAPNSPQ